MIPDTIAKTLGHARALAGFSEEEAAQHANVSVTTIHNSESVYRAKNKHTMELRTFLNLLSAYGLTMAAFEQLAADLAVRARLDALERQLQQVEKRLSSARNDD